MRRDRRLIHKLLSQSLSPTEVFYTQKLLRKNLSPDDHFGRSFSFMAMKGNYRIMKNKLRNSNITKNRMRVALLLVLATSIIGLAPAFSTSAWADFSINDVSGVYVWHAEGWGVGQGNSGKIVPISAVGLITYTPATGTFHVDLNVRFNGENSENLRDGTYTVDATGHGTMTWLSGAGDTRHIDFYIVNSGAELKWIDTDPPGSFELSAIGTMTKQ